MVLFFLWNDVAVKNKKPPALRILQGWRFFVKI